MYMGHAGVALAGSGVWRRIPLWVLLLAAFSSDLADVGLAFAGRGAQVLTHSIPAVAVLSLGLAASYGAVTRDVIGSSVVGAVSLSHWGSDWITSRIPAWPAGSTVGLHLYRYDGWDFALESALVLLGWTLYRRTLPERARNRWPAWAMPLVLIGFQSLFQAMPIT